MTANRNGLHACRHGQILCLYVRLNLPVFCLPLILPEQQPTRPPAHRNAGP